MNGTPNPDSDKLPEPLRALNILDSVSDAVCAFNRDWRFVYANQPAIVMGRKPKEQLIGGDFWEIFPELVSTAAESNLRRTMDEGVQIRFEYFYEPYDLWVEVDSHATPGGIAVFVRDINHRKKGDAGKDALYAALKSEQDRLKLSEGRFRVALKNSPVVVFNQDANLVYTWVFNPLESFPNADWVGMNDRDLGPPGAALVELKLSVLQTGEPYRRELALTLAGQLRYYDLHVEPLWTDDGRIVGLTGSATDVTALRMSQQEVERQQAQLRSVIDGMPGLVSFVDRNYTYRFVNAGYAAWLGQPIEYFEGKPISEVLGQDSMTELRPHFDKAFAGETVTFERRFKFVDAVRNVRATYVPHRAQGGDIEGIVVLIQDITEQKRAEEARWASESRFRRIVEIASEGIWMVDTEGQTTFANNRMADLLGHAPGELLGRRWFEFIHPDDRESGSRGFRQRMEGDTRPREYRAIRRDGGVVWLDFTAATIRDNDGAVTGVLAMCTDITERKLAQDQLQQTQKLESLGVLAGGIAHDFNNLLVGILGNASLAADTLGEMSPVKQMMNDLIAAGERAAQLTRQLLSYAGRDDRRTVPVSLDAIVSEIVPLLHASIPRNVYLRLQLAGDSPYIEGDEGQLQQIVMNLVINGAEAISPGKPGTVSIGTETREPTSAERQRAVMPLADREAHYVVLTVSDTGSGMDERMTARIFDPFFATKFTGRGLGLSAVLGIIKAHSGTLTIETAPGQGTTFRVFLPVTAKLPAEKSPVQRVAPAGSGTILVVDDEAVVRTVAIRTLERAGYTVIAASDGAEAIETVRAHPEIDAVVLDLAMPKMTGDQASPEIRRLRPGIRILLSSGYAEREATERFKGTTINGFLQKPYTARALLEELRRVMLLQGS